MQNSELTLFKTAVQIVENDFIAIKPCCEIFDIDYKNQAERIRNDFLMGQLVGKNHLTGADGKQYQMLSLPKSGFLRWVYTLNPNSIAEIHRQKFIQFVTLIHEYLFGDLNPAKLAKEKQERLAELKESIETTRIEINMGQKNVKELRAKKKKFEAEFWEIFNTDPNQLKLNTGE